MELFMLIFVFNILRMCNSEIEDGGCLISLERKTDPLIFEPRSTKLVYPLPDEDVIQLKTGNVVRLACPGTEVVLNGHTTRQTIVDSTCTSGRLQIQGSVYSWNQISCGGPTISVPRLTRQYCQTDGILLKVGFELSNNEFHELMLICFDTIMQNALYSKYDLTASIGSSVKGSPRPNFHEDEGFYNIGNQLVSHLYKRKQQRKTINHQLGLSDTDTKYISNDQSYFLSKGHLTAKTDFVYSAQQNATFRYINVAPQWQIFNGRNWNSVERYTRTYATKNAVDLQIWSGTYGTATLPNEQSEQNVNLYLYHDGNKNGIPVPALYWKLIYDPFSKEGIVLIGINNPYEENVSKYIICSDISDSTQSWFANFDRKNITNGYVYACTVPEFRRVVKYAPNLQISDVLI